MSAHKKDKGTSHSTAKPGVPSSESEANTEAHRGAKHSGQNIDERQQEQHGTNDDTARAEEIKRLEEQLEEAHRTLEEYKDEAARAKADFYNYRTRVERDRARDRVLAAEGTVDALLPVLDNLDRTLQAVTDKDSPLAKGVQMVQRQFFQALQALGLRVIDTSGQFDPAVHEALMVVETDADGSGKVLEELHRGYMLGDKVLRAAQVKVGK